MDSPWCPVCCSRHASRRDCPGELLATGPERHGWRVNVQTPRGLEAYGVLVAPCDDLWRARIVTYPNVLWIAPGVGGSIKFVGRTARDAERQAARFVRDHCRERGYVLRNELAPVVAEPVPAEARTRDPRPPGSPRKIRFLPIRYGVVRPAELGGTGNLSETGLFVITESPVEPGLPLSLALEMRQDWVDLRGRVVWMRKQHHVGRAPGMGILLAEPPTDYLDYVRLLR